MATQRTQPTPDDVVVRYHGDPERDEFFYAVPARDLTAWEWESLEPVRRVDALAARTVAGKPLYTEVLVEEDKVIPQAAWPKWYRDIVANAGDAEVSPLIKGDTKAIYLARIAKPPETVVDRLADAGLPDVVEGADIPTAGVLPDDADTGGVIPQRVGPLPTPTGDAPEKD